MKTILISMPILLLSLNLVANELDWVDEQIQLIKPARTGISNLNISKISNPFIPIVKEKKLNSKIKSTSLNPIEKLIKKENIYILSAIINKSALINGKWYKLHENIEEFELTNVDRKEVTLSKKGKKIILSTRVKNKNLKFKTN